LTKIGHFGYTREEKYQIGQQLWSFFDQFCAQVIKMCFDVVDRVFSSNMGFGINPEAPGSWVIGVKNPKMSGDGRDNCLNLVIKTLALFARVCFFLLHRSDF
jgi:hypothetical protein